MQAVIVKNDRAGIFKNVGIHVFVKQGIPHLIHDEIVWLLLIPEIKFFMWVDGRSWRRPRIYEYIDVVMRTEERQQFEIIIGNSGMIRWKRSEESDPLHVSSKFLCTVSQFNSLVRAWPDSPRALASALLLSADSTASAIILASG